MLAVSRLGLIAAPLLATVVYWWLPVGPGQLSPAGAATATIGCLMAVLWLTEALPLAVTSLLPIVLFPLTGALPIDEATAPYAHPYIFLFMGGFMIALAMESWNLHRRIALMTVLAVGTQPLRLVGGFMLTTAFLSMWISNSAAAMLMLPIGLSLIGLVSDGVGRDAPAGDTSALAAVDRSADGMVNFPACLMLSIAYAANIGGMGTLIGSPPNLVLAGFLTSNYDLQIGFGRWMAMAVPLVVVFLAVTWLVLTKFLLPIHTAEISGGREMIRHQLAELGRPTRGEWTVAVVFLSTATAWVLREPLTKWDWLARQIPAVTRLTDTTIAIAAAVALFAIPVDFRRGQFALDWQTARKLPWNVLLLFGGGLSLAAAVQASRLDAWIADLASTLGDLPPLGLMILTTTLIVYLTELTSNTATANTFFPILGGVAVGADISPPLLLIPACLAASCAFMMPVATPPNAIVFGSGHVTIRQMLLAGFWLNLIGLVLVVALSHVAGQWVVTPGPS